MKQQKTVEHNIEGPGKPVLQEKQVFLVCTTHCFYFRLNKAGELIDSGPKIRTRMSRAFKRAPT